MKKVLFVIVALFAFSMQGVAQKVTVDGITYKIKDNQAIACDIETKLETAVFASSVTYKGKDYPVTTIAELSQSNKDVLVGVLTSGWSMIGKKYPKVKTVIIPNSVTEIGKWSFLYCEQLESVSIPNSVEKIGYAAFAGCTKLESISIPNSVKTIGIGAFQECNHLREVIVPDQAIEIYTTNKSNGNIGAASAFSGCKSITTVRCQNGSFPTYMLSCLPMNSPFVMANKYQQPLINSNDYAQKIPSPNNPSEESESIHKTLPSSDVDLEIPQTTANNKNTFAIIIANENYQEEAKVEYALNDGEIFREYCHKVMGIPEENVHIRKDATLNNIKAELSWMQQVADAYDGEARFIIFYAGHGIPDEKSAEAYLLPVDGKGTMLDTGYSLAKLYETLGNMPAERITVFMDACFSGSKRGDGMLASARGVAIRAKAQAPQGKMVVFSAAQGDETAYPYKEKEHGLFTYYLLKKLKETEGSVTYGELSDYLQTEVKRKSIVANSKSQTPTVSASTALGDSWKKVTLK